MINKELWTKLSVILNASQDSAASHAKLLIKCNKLYKEVN
jgi:hypothetical protein